MKRETEKKPPRPDPLELSRETIQELAESEADAARGGLAPDPEPVEVAPSRGYGGYRRCRSAAYGYGCRTR